MKARRISAALALLLLLTACNGPVTESPTPTPASVLTPVEIPEETPGETPAISFSPVYTDWSKLEPYEPKTPVYTRRYEEFTDTLIPANDYGPLLTFGGTIVTTREEWDDKVDSYDYRLIGLVTAEGEVVLDPVLSSVVNLYGMDGWRNESFNTDSMLLGKVFYNEEGEPVERFALCDRKGRWCTDFLYTYDWDTDFGLSFAWGVPLFTSDRKLVFLDPATGRDIWTVNLPAHFGTADFSLRDFDIDPASGWVCLSVTCSDRETGKTRWENLFIDPQGVVRKPPEEVQGIYGYGDGLVLAVVSVNENSFSRYRYGYVDAFTGKWAIEPIYTKATRFVNGVAPVNDGEKIYLINTAGEALTGDLEVMPERYGRYWYVKNSAGVKLFDEEANPVTDSLLPDVGSIHWLGNGWVRGKVGSDYVLARGDIIYHFPADLGTPSDIRENWVLFEGKRLENDRKVMTLADLEGNIIARWDSFSGGWFTRDIYTGESYLYLYVYKQPGGATYDMEGNCLDNSGRSVTISCGRIWRSDDDHYDRFGRQRDLLLACLLL